MFLPQIYSICVMFKNVYIFYVPWQSNLKSIYICENLPHDITGLRRNLSTCFLIKPSLELLLLKGIQI